MREMFYILRRSVLSLLVALCVAVAPLSTHAAVSWPDIVGQTYKATLEKIMDIIQQIQSAAVTAAVAMSAMRTVNAVVEDAGGRITDWPDYLREADEISRKNILEEITREIAVTTDEGGIDSASARSVEYVRAVLTSDDQKEIASVRQYTRGATATINADTGRVEAPNIAALTETFSNPYASVIAAQVAKDRQRNEETLQREARSLAQVGAGYNSPRAQEVAQRISDQESAIASMVLDRATSGSIASALLGSVVSRLQARITDGVRSFSDAAMQRVKDDVASRVESIKGADALKKIY